jgi:hypothetical protein
MDRRADDQGMTSAATTRRSLVETLAWQVAADGVARHEAAVRTLADQAVAAGAAPVVAQVALDATAPPAVRERAFGLLARAVLAGAAEPTVVERELVAC